VPQKKNKERKTWAPGNWKSYTCGRRRNSQNAGGTGSPSTVAVLHTEEQLVQIILGGHGQGKKKKNDRISDRKKILLKGQQRMLGKLGISTKKKTKKMKQACVY
jgi:hypothetical protein